MTILAAVSASFALPAGAAAAPAHCAPAVVGHDSFCRVNGIRLQYVDWGGRGPAIILLTGLGDSARIFDDFAPLLTHGHRVVAMTRRGYGLSAMAPDGDYSNATLVGDVIGLMDALAISKASFVGHSIAGGELAGLGMHHPDRVDRLVYLDSAYDRAEASALMKDMPKLPPPSKADMANLDALARWREAALGVKTPAIRADLGDIMKAGPAGLMPRVPADVAAKVLAGDIAAKADWGAIAAPSLAFFTSKDVLDQVPATATAAQRAAFLAFSLRELRPWMLRAQADFLDHAKCGVAVEVPRSTHYLFLTGPVWLARQILSFLASDQPCEWSSIGLASGQNAGSDTAAFKK